MGIKTFAPVITLLFCSSIFLSAQGSFQTYQYKMTVSGTSSLHDWTSDVNDVRTTASLTVTGGQITAISRMDVRVKVTSIISRKGSIMDKKTHNALLADKHPDILFQLTKVNSITQNGNTATIDASGYLTIAGTKKSIQMTVKGTVLNGGSVKLTGSKALKMTDFGVTPPTAMLGTLKTGNVITIDFSQSMKPSLQ